MNDHAAIARLHWENLDRGFLRTLGLGFLTELYRAIDGAQDAILLTESMEGRVVGFVAGGRGMGAIYRRLLARLPQVLTAVAPRLINPRVVWRMAETMAYGGRRRARAEAELLFIAVDPAARGAGVAERLYRGLCDAFAARGIGRFEIMVGAELAAARRFYTRMGARPAGEISVHAGERSIVYVHDLADAGDNVR